jgi:hypothetical protein
MITYFLNLIHDVGFLVLVTIKAICTQSNNFKKPVTKNRAMVLGNGPSLQSDMNTILSRRTGADLYCVNAFALTEYFAKLKPDFYVFADPMYWIDNINEDMKKNRTDTISALLEANWPITIICLRAGVPFLTSSLSRAPHIQIIGVTRNECQFKIFSVHMLALKYGLATPNFINVVILALWWCIVKKIPDIELYGVDFSAHLELKLDQNTGEASTGAKHFYEANKTDAMKKLHLKYTNAPRRKMHERFYQIWQSFYQMHLLSELSKVKKLNLVNFSSYTNLDTIKRP